MPQSSVNYRNYQSKYWQVPLYVAFFHTDLSWLCIDCWQHLQMWFPLVQKTMFLWDSHYCLTRFYAITCCDVCGNDLAFAESAMRNSMTCLQAIRTKSVLLQQFSSFLQIKLLKEVTVPQLVLTIASGTFDQLGCVNIIRSTFCSGDVVLSWQNT